MPDQKVIWLVLVTLAQAVLIGLKIIEYLSKKKDKEPVKVGNNPHPCKDHADQLREHGIKIGKVETALEKLEENNKEDHDQLRENITRIFKLLNGARK